MTTQPQNEFYSLSDAEAQRAYVSVRRAAEWVPFFLPHLKPGFSVLDCGCGVGSITMDIAELVAPGEVIGIDMDESQLEIARAHSKQRGLTNITFEQGNIYQLRFDDNTFDAALAHTLLYHLSDQGRALREMRRVLKPGGVAAVSDDEFNSVTYSPENTSWRKLVDLWKKVVLHNGGNPVYSRHLRGLMLEARFVRAEGHAVATEHYGTLEETRRWATIVNGVIRSPDFVKLVIAENWITQAELNEMYGEIEKWGERPDAFFAIMYCTAVGWK